MGLRNVARSLVLKAVSGARLNELALSLSKRKADSSRIVVVEMHETLSAHADQLRRQLDWVAEHFTFIDPESFAHAWEKKVRTWPGSKPAVLFTFDDGRECNYRVAAPLLESFGTRGIFFVVPQFIGRSAINKDARDFYYSKIDIRKRTPAAVQQDAQQDEIWKPMTPEQLADLARRGHWIGNHTLSHVALAGLSAPELHREIDESCEQIASWTGKPVSAFAWPYSWDAIDRDSWALVKESHRFCFAPCPGIADLVRDSQHLIWRKEIESYYHSSEYRFMYSGLVDPIWAARRKKLRKMLCH
jgi:peptidoglycan/xylan/chitin deacetylase (PgdA/CDA1 family)